MPSLNELGRFKSSFNDIANEKADIESLNLPFDDLKLPDNEAPSFNYSRDTPYSAGAPGDVDFTPETGSHETESPAGDFDFNTFINDLPAGAPPPPDTSPGISALDDLLSGLNGVGTQAVDQPEDTSPEPPPDEPAIQKPDQSAKKPAGDSTPDNFPGDHAVEDEMPDLPEDAAFDDPFAGFPAGVESTPEFEDIKNGDTLPDGFDNINAEPQTLPDDFNFDDEPLTLPNDDFNLGDEPLTFPDDDFNLDEKPAAGGSLNLDDFPDLEESIDLGGEKLDTDSFPDFTDPAAGQTDELPDLDNLPDFQTGADDALPDLDDFDLGGGSIDLGGEAPVTSTSGADEFSLDDALPDFDAGFDDFTPSDPGADAPAGFDGFNAGSPPAAEGSPIDADFDIGDLDFSTPSGETAVNTEDFGSDFTSDSIDLGGGTTDAEHMSDDVFAFDGLDDILNKSKTEAQPAAPPPKKGLFGKKKAQEEPEAEENIEEISLKQDDVDNLLKTLSLYPLNLRIICEELIAEQVILPQQLAKLIRLLVNGAPVKETAAHVESITGKSVVIPKSFEKMTGAALEEEQASFGYIFTHNFLPVIRLIFFVLLMAGSVIYLGYRFIYTPLRAESIYQRGYERIPAGEYQRANDLFHQAFEIHRKKNWFYSYAEAFRDQRRYSLAEGKYDELLKNYPRDKKGVLDYAGLNTNYLMNFEKANRLLQRELLDFAPSDMEGLLAAGDNFLYWADSNPDRYYNRYEDARFSYARLLELYGWQPAVVERMMKYFIRTDNLRETLNLRAWFENNLRYNLSAESLAELGGYLLDKQLEKPAGVPDPYIGSIESVRSMLLQAVMAQPTLPEPHYHLARYHHNLNNTTDERLTLENAIRAFNLAETESVRRRKYRSDTHYRYANLLINNSEFFHAEENIVRGIGLYEDFMDRNLITASPALGQLYALKGDLEYFVKSGDMEAALNNYRAAERYDYSPPEIQYRMGAAYYQTGNWGSSLEYLFKAASELPLNRRILYALGNTAYQRGDYFAAQGYYTRLLDVLENQRIRLPLLLPNDGVQFQETGERLMMARNNLGAVNEALAEQTGNREYRSSALVMYSESARAWDAITRNPETMTRMRLTDSPGAPSINLGYLNANNALRPNSEYSPQIFPRIDRDVEEPSRWEELTGY